MIDSSAGICYLSREKESHQAAPRHIIPITNYEERSIMNASRFVLSLLLVVSLTWIGCAYALAPVTGFVYSDVKGPMSATSNSGFSKVGTAEATSILGWVATGDASIQTAMRNGGITKIHHVDYYSRSILGVYAVFTVTVYGE